jgi:putative hydrolase of the HAD superfamily
LAALRVEFFSGDRVDRDLIDRIRGLRPAYRTGMVSNAWPDLRRVLVSRYPIADAFDTIVISGEEHVAKPDPEIFQRALERLQVEPAQAVMIDDMEVNIAAARDCGMHAIRFENPTQAWSALEELLAGTP